MILSCQNINKSFVTDDVLKDVSFHLEEREKAALIGPNGAGKSTLLKIIMQEMPADSGEVIVAKGKTLGYLAQHQEVSGDNTIYGELLSVKQYLLDMEEKIRTMEQQKPPIRIIAPGRVYRNETTDARHERAFFQYEALIVDKDFTFASGKVMIKSILSKVFGRDVPVRMRAGFFPFVEPGFEIDMGCLVCGGKGCSVCKHVGWIEIMPGGTPHPNVLRSAGLDPDEYTGFYVNIGLDRLVMMRYGVDDVRMFHSADLRFLEQFR